jgi:hypothetical protein
MTPPKITIDELVPGEIVVEEVYFLEADSSDPPERRVIVDIRTSGDITVSVEPQTRRGNGLLSTLVSLTGSAMKVFGFLRDILF